MTTTSIIKPGLGDNWSSFGAIVVVSILGPALILLVTIAPVIAVELASVLLDFSLCIYLNTCVFAGSGAWATWLVNDGVLLYAFWVSLGAGFVCVATFETAFYFFRRAAALPVLGWHATLIFILTLYLPIEPLRSLISLGWAGTALVSGHYYLSYKALPLYQPPEATAGKAHEASPVSHATAESIDFPSDLSPRRLWVLGANALYVAALFGLAYYAFAKEWAILVVSGVGAGLYLGLLLLHQFLSSNGARALTIGSPGLICHGQCLSWCEIGRVWSGPDGYRHVVAIETPAEAAKRILQATNWVNRLFALCKAPRRNADMVAHEVIIDTRIYLGGAAELVQAIEARRPPGSRWKPAAEVS